MTNTRTFFSRYIRRPSITIIVHEHAGACYIRTGLTYRRVCDLIPPAFSEPLPLQDDGLLMDDHPETFEHNRFAQYSCAVVTALARSHNVGRIYIYGTDADIASVIYRLPTSLRAICIPRNEHTLRTILLLFVEHLRTKRGVGMRPFA
jgi:hypothetical protein